MTSTAGLQRHQTYTGWQQMYLLMNDSQCYVHTEGTTATINFLNPWATHAVVHIHNGLRVSEYTMQSPLVWCHILSQLPFYQMQQSKTDPFWCGCTIKIFKTKSSTCPYHTFKVYLRNPATSTYVVQAGRFPHLSCSAVTKTLRKLLRVNQCGTRLFNNRMTDSA